MKNFLLPLLAAKSTAAAMLLPLWHDCVTIVWLYLLPLVDCCFKFFISAVSIDSCHCYNLPQLSLTLPLCHNYAALDNCCCIFVVAAGSSWLSHCEQQLNKSWCHCLLHSNSCCCCQHHCYSKTSNGVTIDPASPWYYLLPGSVALLQPSDVGVTVTATITIRDAAGWKLLSLLPPLSPLADSCFLFLLFVIAALFSIMILYLLLLLLPLLLLCHCCHCCHCCCYCYCLVHRFDSIAFLYQVPSCL